MTDRVMHAYKLCFEAACEGGVERILQTANSLFDSPVLLTDENYHIILQVPSAPIGNNIWDTLYSKKVLPLDIIWEYQKLFLEDKVDIYRPFYADWGPAANYPRIFAEIYTGNKVYGHLAIFLGNRPLMADDLVITQIIVDTINIEISRNCGNPNIWQSSYSTCLYDLLNKESSFEMRELAVQKLTLRLTGDFAVIVAPIGISASQRAFASYIVSSLNTQLKSTLSILFDDSIITVLGEIIQKSFVPRENSVLNQIVKIFSEHKMSCGLSDCFSSLYEIPMRFRQADLTAKLVAERKSEPIGIYSDYVPAQMFLAISEFDSPGTFIHPALSEIRNYDKKNNTEYYETLKVFSLCMHNKFSASVQLAIHRNTLLYRLNRIEELFKLHYEDEKTALYLLCSFLLEEINDL